MKLLQNPIGRRGLAAAAAAALLVAVAAPASATPATLKRSVQNLTQWPLDIALAPYTSGKAIAENLNAQGDTTAVKIAYPVPGYVWNLFVNVGASVLRGVTGVIEFVPGLILLPLDAELRPLFDPAEASPAVVDWQNPVYDLRFGVSYTQSGF